MKFEIMMPWALVLIPIVIAFIYFSLRRYKGVRNRDYFIIVSRVLVMVLLILALSDITISLKGKNTVTIFLLDTSESMSSFKEEGVKFINKSLQEMPKNNKAGVVVFGGNSEVDKIIDNDKKYLQINNTPIKTATNIENAISSAVSLFPSGVSKRIVLISDGEENQGEVIKDASLIKEQDIDFRTYKVSNEKGNEVYVDNVKVPDNIAIGEEFSVVITLESNVKTSANLVLFSGRDKKAEQRVEVQKGKNTFVFKDVQTSGGFKGYRVLIEPDDDTSTVNNEYTCFTNVTAPAKILLIEGKSGDGAGAINVLKAANSDMKVITSSAAPRDLNELLEYKTIVLCNVHSDDLNSGFMNNIESYVKDYGGGVVTFGGEDSYVLGGYKDTALEKILPVDMDKKGKNEIPQISLSLIIDKSGSMSSGDGSTSKLTLAIEAALKAVDNLRDTDEISVIAFDDGFSYVVEPQKVQDKDKIKEKISGITVRGGTSIYPPLKDAIEKQIESSAKIKHTILLTDGEDGFPESGYDDVISKINENNITLSTVSVGTDANSTLLENLAKKGNGRSYHTDIFTDIPRIFAKEILISTGEYIINDEFTPKIVSSHEITRGLVNDGLPSVLGYIGTSKKDKAIEILRTKEDEPLLAVYQYGLGKTVSWTSDINGQWSKNYLSWKNGAQLIKNMIYWTIPEYGDGGNVNVTVSGDEAVIDFYSDDVKKGSKLSGHYNSEEGEEGKFELSEVEPGRYQGKVNINDLGFYNFNIREENDGKIVNSYNGAFAMQYSEEFKFNDNSGNIDILVNEVNGKFINKASEVFTGKEKIAYKKIQLKNICLVIAILLFFFDIVYRRLNLDYRKLLAKIPIKKVKSFYEKRKDKKVVVVEKKVDKEVNIEKKKKVKTKKINKKASKEKEVLDTSALLKKKEKRE